MNQVRVKLVEKHVRPNKPDLLRTVCWFVKEDGRPWIQGPPPMRDRQSEALGQMLDHGDIAGLMGSLAAGVDAAATEIGNRDSRTDGVLRDSPAGGKLLEIPGLTARWEKVTPVLDRIAAEVGDGATLTVDVLRRLIG